MTWPPLPGAENPFTKVAAHGCTGDLPNGQKCGTQNTPWLSAVHGRRCDQHIGELPTYLTEEKT